MNVLITSDIHANYEALIALEDLFQKADQVICLGDFVGYYCQVNEVLDFLRPFNPICILGNHDSSLLKGVSKETPDAVKFGIEYADKVIEKSHRDWLAGLPHLWGGELDTRTFLLAHGSPWSPMDDYLYPDSPELERLGAFNFNVVAFGQTHRPIQQTDRRPFLINPGSVGQSRNERGVACATMLDTNAMHATAVSRPYDVTKVVELARANGAKDWITKYLLR